jgi:hypothetical protein
MQHFRKYELTATQWATLRKKIEKTVDALDGAQSTHWDNERVSVVVDLGKLCKEWGVNAEGMTTCTKVNTKVSIDIVWVDTPLADFDKHLVWCEPVGVHSMGATLDNEYAEAYYTIHPKPTPDATKLN